MIKSALKSTIPKKYWNRLCLLKQSSRKKKSAREYFSAIANKGGPILTKDDMSIISLLPKESNSILEVGCGGGRLTFWLIYSGYNVTAIEPDPWYRNRVGKFLKTNLPGKSFQILDGDIHKLDFSNNQFDTVICSAVIEHVDDPQKGVRELIRVARKCVIVTTPVGHSCPSPDHKHIFFEEGIDGLFREYDYELRRNTTGAHQQIENFLIHVKLS